MINKGPIIFGLVLAVLVPCIVVPVMWHMQGEIQTIQQEQTLPPISITENTKIEYIKDPRTDLCFAVMNSTVVGYGVVDDVQSFTLVPCESIKQNTK